MSFAKLSLANFYAYQDIISSFYTLSPILDIRNTVKVPRLSYDGVIIYLIQILAVHVKF